MTPTSATVKVEKARCKEVLKQGTEEVDGGKLIATPDGKTGAEKVREWVNGPGSKSGKPDVSIVVEAMGREFKVLLGTRGLNW
jgi:hypothetical protein